MKHNVVEPRKVIKQAIQSATEMSMMILRIDKVITASKGGGGPKAPSPSDEFDDMPF